MGLYYGLRVGAVLVRNVRVTMGTVLGVSLVSLDGIGGGFHVVVAMGLNVGITVGPSLGVSMVPPNNVGCSPGEGIWYRIDVGVY